MKRPSGFKHGSTSTCARCQQPIQYWDGNPGHSGAFWYHVREYTDEQIRWNWRHSQFCLEDKATPDVGIGAPCDHPDELINEYGDTCTRCGTRPAVTIGEDVPR